MNRYILTFNKFLTKIFHAISPRLYFSLVYFKYRGKIPNLKNPKDISEIVLSYIYTGKINQFAIYADKVRMREKIEEWGLGVCLPKLYGVWKSPDEIDFSKLPNSFALKTNHGCRHHYICPDKSKLDENLARKAIKEALEMNFGGIETHYSLIDKLCFAEEYIDDGTGTMPTDYKFMCCDATVRCLFCCVERATENKRIFYDLNWNELPYARGFKRSKHGIAKPKNFEKMAEIAKILATKFPYVRVDLYSLPDGRILIGELTFTPEGGFVRYFSNEAVRKLGHLDK